MLLKQLLESPQNSSKLVVFDPFRELDREELVKEVIGLANADVDGPRNILFGVNAGAVDGSGIVGIAESAMLELKKAHRLLSALIEPTIPMAFIYDMVGGKLVGALEIDGCDIGPYVVGIDFSDTLSRGACWVREGWKLREVERADLLSGQTPATTTAPTTLTDMPDLVVGFRDEPTCDFLELDVPDTSDPPFAGEQASASKTSKFKQAIKDTVGTMTTQILGFGHGPDKRSQSAPGEDADPEACEETGKVLADARNHYYYEEKAVQLNLCVSNQGAERVEDVSIEIGFPRLPDFDVADRLYTSPFDRRSAAEIRRGDYPEVERRDDAIIVRSSVGAVAPETPEQAFRCPLRLAVGPDMQGRKVALLYKLRGPQKQVIGKGRLKIKFARRPSNAA